jgi:hypothetical protein
MPQICDIGFTSLPKEGMLRKKSDGFGRELGYQRPAC